MNIKTKDLSRVKMTVSSFYNIKELVFEILWI